MWTVAAGCPTSPLDRIRSLDYGKGADVRPALRWRSGNTRGNQVSDFDPMVVLRTPLLNAGLRGGGPSHSKRIEVIRPPPGHAHAFIPILTSRIRPPDGVAVLVGQGALDGV